MDATLLCSLIQAAVTCISILVAAASLAVAVVLANRQIKASFSQLRAQLAFAQEQMKLSGYENLLQNEQRVFDFVLRDETSAREFLRHFWVSGTPCPRALTRSRCL